MKLIKILEIMCYIFSGAGITLLLLLLIYGDLTIEIRLIKTPKYKVYYEYNVINNDSIAIDTVYVKLN